MNALKVQKCIRPETKGLYLLAEYVDWGTTKPYSIVNKEELQKIHDDGYYNLEGDIEDVI